MDIRHYLDATYLKTIEDSGLSENQHLKVVEDFIFETIDGGFKLVMIRPNMVALARKMVQSSHSKVLVGTVIDFPNGDGDLSTKIAEAEKAIADGADELDFVCNYQAFKEGNSNVVKEEILVCTRLGLEHHKVVKWIIEVAALTEKEIIQISALIKNVVIQHFKEECYQQVFVKSSTGFFKTNDNLPNGATLPTIKMMLENASPLPIKAAGGVRTYDEAVEMIKLGVKRIGTSAAKTIAEGGTSSASY
ncbi:MAG: deoxyribose-phosphate aldolase [Flavobacterium sp.]